MSPMTVAHCGQLVALSNESGRSSVRTEELYTGSFWTAAALSSYRNERSRSHQIHVKRRTQNACSQSRAITTRIIYF